MQAPSATAEAYAFPFFLPLSLPPSFPSFVFSQQPFMAKIFKHRKDERTVTGAALLLPLESIANNSLSWLLYLACYLLRCNSHTTKFTLGRAPFSGFGIFAKMCSHLHRLTPEHFAHTNKNLCAHLQSPCTSPRNLLSVS